MKKNITKLFTILCFLTIAILTGCKPKIEVNTQTKPGQISVGYSIQNNATADIANYNTKLVCKTLDYSNEKTAPAGTKTTFTNLQPEAYVIYIYAYNKNNSLVAVGNNSLLVKSDSSSEIEVELIVVNTGSNNSGNTNTGSGNTDSGNTNPGSGSTDSGNTNADSGNTDSGNTNPGNNNTQNSDEDILANISIATFPETTTYAIGADLNTEGMIVIASYKNGNVKVAEGWTCLGFSSDSVIKNLPVTVSYTENGITRTNVFYVTITDEISLMSLEITKMPDQLSYWVGAPALNTEGIEVTAHYNNGFSWVVDEWTTSNFDSRFLLPAESIKVSYTENGVTKDAFFSISFHDNPPATYTFTEVPVILPEDTDGTYGTEKTYVLFGDWPSTRKKDDVIVNPYVKDCGWYLGSDGNYYGRTTTLEPAVANGKYSDESPIISGIPEYFLVEPIKWAIVKNDDTNTYLLSEKIIYNLNYSNGSSSLYYYYSSSNLKAFLEGSKLDYSSDWTTTGFKVKAFTNNSRKNIFISSTEGNLKNSADYGLGTNQFRIRHPSDYALARKGTSAWWTGGGYGTSISSSYYYYAYYTDNKGNCTQSVSTASALYGVVPLIYVKNTLFN